jgi:hypothetical protein
MSQNDIPTQEKFQPWGAVAFFVVLLIIIVGIWFAMYFLMLSRA